MKKYPGNSFQTIDMITRNKELVDYINKDNYKMKSITKTQKRWISVYSFIKTVIFLPYIIFKALKNM